eukprot:gene43372-53020_t
MESPAPTRQDLPAAGCRAKKEEFLESRKNPLGPEDFCPICREDYAVLCRVANHPSRHEPQPGTVLFDQTGKKLSFKDGVAQWGWTRDVEDLYVRDCYNSAIETLSEVDMAMLEGTPGIGKSLFIFYYIYILVRQAQERKERVPTFIIADRDGTEYFLRVDSNDSGIVHKPTTETPDYLITDTKGRANPSFIKQYIHVSSINNKNVKDVRKLMEQRQRKYKKSRRTIYLPGFSLEEYFEIDGGGETNQV